MEPEDKKPQTVDAGPQAMEGTAGKGYWDFKKEFCDPAGWKLRRIDPQTYDVLDGKGVKLGVFESEKGYFPVLQPMEGTFGKGYWDFKKEFCDPAGWKLRRVDPQTYDVLDGKGVKLGVFESEKGYFPIAVEP